MVEMQSVVWVAVGVIAVSAVLLTWSLSANPGEARQRSLENLRRDFSFVGERGASGAPSSDIERLARRYTSRSTKVRVDRLLAGAGRPKHWPLERVLVGKVILGFSFACLGAWLMSTRGSIGVGLLAAALAVFGWFMPDVLLYNTAIKRRKEIALKLPDVLDQLTIAVEAGLGFEAALAHVGRNTPGALGSEVIRALQDIQVGVPRHVSYRAMSERAGVPDLTRFVRAINQAEQYGVSIASVLNAQSREMRVKRRQRAQEAAMKIPVKVIFPLMLFILPALFIVVLGPAVLNIIEAFSEDGLLGGIP